MGGQGGAEVGGGSSGGGGEGNGGSGGAGGQCDLHPLLPGEAPHRSSEDIRIQVDQSFPCQATPLGGATMQFAPASLDGTPVTNFACPAAHAQTRARFSLGGLVLESVSAPKLNGQVHVSHASIGNQSRVTLTRVAATTKPGVGVSLGDMAHSPTADYALVAPASHIVDASTQMQIGLGDFVLRRDRSTGNIDWVRFGRIGPYGGIAIADDKLVVARVDYGGSTPCLTPTGVNAQFGFVATLEEASSFATHQVVCSDVRAFADLDAPTSLTVNDVDAGVPGVVVVGSYEDQIVFPSDDTAATDASFSQRDKGFAMLLSPDCNGGLDTRTIVISSVETNVEVESAFWQPSGKLWLVGSRSGGVSPLSVRACTEGNPAMCTPMGTVDVSGSSFVLSFDPEAPTFSFDVTSGNFSADADVSIGVGGNPGPSLVLLTEQASGTDSPSAQCVAATGRGVFAVRPDGGCTFTSF